MNRLRLRALLAGTAVALTAGSSLAVAARPKVDSDSTVGTSQIHQEIDLIGSSIHYWIRVTDPHGPPPYCVTLELERRRDGAWHGLGVDPGQHRGVRECCPDPKPDESCESSGDTSAWDLFVYPSKRNFKAFKAGELRVRGSTDLGPSLAFRP
jgi:hypothetical protein